MTRLGGAPPLEPYEQGMLLAMLANVLAASVFALADLWFGPRPTQVALGYAVWGLFNFGGGLLLWRLSRRR